MTSQYLTFTETQRFNKWWHYLLAGFPILLTTGIFIMAWIKGADTQQDSFAPITMGITLLLPLLIFIWFLLLKMKTHIDHTGIKVNYAWMPFCKRTIAWSEIRDISVISYSPLSDYGGWGVRYSHAGNGWCYNVSGDKGIKLFYQNGKPFLIGTQQAEEAEKMIDHYFKK